MKFKELIYNGNSIIGDKNIIKILEKDQFYWLIDSEIEDAEIEITHNTVVWKSGDFFAGNWYYGIWKSGNFYGTWENGIFEGGNFKGKFISGIRTST